MKQITTERNARRAGKAASFVADRHRRERERQVKAAHFDNATMADMTRATGLSERVVREYCKRLNLDLARAKPKKSQPKTASASAVDLARMKW